ncbi:phosphoadenosine phosphosulfate reductase domain-containing protein [Priestia megaterium]|uniref:Phosphoadenosine phosphosulfate reductase family protein n=1 Tax=Priestia megaterium TaxID=1404 RepID=A0A6M6E4Y9_PRIMG|nr:phosphoadenosine phosphosulfate reductase family protein [Priestia megaterium]QJX80239.1 phosphoadenosine phosphosulfate reductase family protein [Priestia megaterium]
MAIKKMEEEQETLFVNVLSLKKYDKIIVSMSGGKDSLACLLHLLELGVSRRKIELAHQCVDGGPDDEEFMDWPVTEAYCKAISIYFGIPIYFQWRKGGILGEMMRKDSSTNDVYFEQKVRGSKKKVVKLDTTRKIIATRLKFPAVKADLRQRWCSSVVKIDPFRRALNNNPHYVGKKILVVTGERREESPKRAKYEEVEYHTCHSGRKFVHSWRPVIDWKEDKVWSIIERWKIQPHPAYMLGWGRMSCFGCIFSSPQHWAMMKEIAPHRFEILANKEKEINYTMYHKLTLEEKAAKGDLELLPKGEELDYWVKKAMSRDFAQEDIVVENWKLPKGAFRGSAGGPS